MFKKCARYMCSFLVHMLTALPECPYLGQKSLIIGVVVREIGCGTGAADKIHVPSTHQLVMPHREQEGSRQRRRSSIRVPVSGLRQFSCPVDTDWPILSLVNRNVEAEKELPVGFMANAGQLRGLLGWPLTFLN